MTDPLKDVNEDIKKLQRIGVQQDRRITSLQAQVQALSSSFFACKSSQSFSNPAKYNIEHPTELSSVSKVLASSLSYSAPAVGGSLALVPGTSEGAQR